MKRDAHSHDAPDIGALGSWWDGSAIIHISTMDELEEKDGCPGCVTLTDDVRHVDRDEGNFRPTPESVCCIDTALPIVDADLEEDFDEATRPSPPSQPSVGPFQYLPSE